MHKQLRIITLVAVMATSGHTTAQISLENLPKPGSISALFKKPNFEKVDKKIEKTGGLIASGIQADESQRGKFAELIAIDFAQSIPGMTNAEFTEVLMAARTETESYLQTKNYAMQDMGVAYAFSFITLHEIATAEKLSEAAALNAGKYLVTEFSGMAPQYLKMEQNRVAQFYDQMMTLPIFFTILRMAIEEQPNEQAMSELRMTAAQLFRELALVPADIFSFDGNGVINFKEEKLQQWHSSRQASTESAKAIDSQTSSTW